ncbi:hypothetical protein P1X14_07760 [Sphingomonas sp. AOB5]|uniref:hypothetical protein n=1 Tax=Sphingomonas sp. AOB5 TaxID=3034017 RepID=UPI0023F9B069|nr:hypothetical protein [Sphingomonas sp. AOB5]MDF7775138.1 hypothetical protein [Sphingomonas sp. AOB5]
MSVREMREWYRARPGYWFRPKRYGWGATPVTWQGWAATFALIASAVLIGSYAQGLGMIRFALLVPLVLGFLLLCRAKTDGEWRWRWGG